MRDMGGRGGHLARTFSSLRIRNFRYYFAGQSLSLIGTWMQSIAQSWLVFARTHSGLPGRSGRGPADPPDPAPRAGRGDHRRPLRQVPHPLLHPGPGRRAGPGPGRARPYRTPAAVGVVRDRPARWGSSTRWTTRPARRSSAEMVGTRPARQRRDPQLGDGQRGPGHRARRRRVSDRHGRERLVLLDQRRVLRVRPARRLRAIRTRTS